MKKIAVLILVIFVLAGCEGKPQTAVQGENEQPPISQPTTSKQVTLADLPEPPEIFYPMSRYSGRLTFKKFGQEVHDRFNGWHVGDDLEIVPEELNQELPVYAIADGKLVYRNWLAGYGGVVVLQHEIDGQQLQSLYGHVDLEQTRARIGDFIKAGTPFTYLGDHESRETDGERKHLHFGLYPGTGLRLPGYVERPVLADNWINPKAYLDSHHAAEPGTPLQFPSDWTRQSLRPINETFRLSFLLPPNWKAEYVPGAEAITIYSEEGKSNLFIRQFKATTFLTLSTVDILQRHLGEINGHEVVEYEIQKKRWAANFPSQPDWRNGRHTVTDIREQDGFSQFYVMAQNPELDQKLVYYILNSVQIEPE